MTIWGRFPTMRPDDCFVSEEELNLYLDHQIGLRRKTILDSHMQSCGECAVRYGIALKLANILKNPVIRTAAPAYLNGRISALIAEGKPIAGEGFWEMLKNLLSDRPYIPVGAAAGLLAVFVFALFSGHSPKGNMPFIKELVHEHYEYIEEPERLGIRSDDPQEIVRWVSDNAGMDIGFSATEDADMPSPEGACVLEENGETIGYVFFDQLGQRVSLFMIADYRDKLFGQTSMSLDDISVYCGKCTGMNYVLWKNNDLVCVLIADLSPDNLVKIARHII